jgi:hypothetical protein
MYLDCIDLPSMKLNFRLHPISVSLQGRNMLSSDNEFIHLIQKELAVTMIKRSEEDIEWMSTDFPQVSYSDTSDESYLIMTLRRFPSQKTFERLVSFILYSLFVSGNQRKYSIENMQRLRLLELILIPSLHKNL